MNTGAFDIATFPIAEAVHRKLISNYYLEMLDGLQKEANRLDYSFVVKSENRVFMPPPLLECLERALMYARERYLSPFGQELWDCRVDGYLKDGYSYKLLDEIIDFLWSLGIGLQEGPRSAELLAEEELRKREAENSPPDPDDAILKLLAEIESVPN